MEQVAIPLPGDLSTPRTEPVSLMSPALAGGFFTTEPPGKPIWKLLGVLIKFLIAKWKYLF